jgi:phosphoserine phosphatase RsbU/P
MGVERMNDSDKRAILIVDDERDFRRVFRDNFEDLGYRVFEAGDGEEGLALATEHAGELRLVVTDIKMPKMDGEQLIRTLRERWPSLPILGITAHDDIKTKLHLLGQGAYYYLNKPLDPWPVVERLVENAIRVYEVELEIRSKRRREEEMARLVRNYLLHNAALGSAPSQSNGGLTAASGDSAAMGGRLLLDLDLRAIEIAAPGGDFAEWFERRGDELVFYLADASGHASVVACILACLSSLILHRCHHARTPTVIEMIEEIDQVLTRLREAGALDAKHYLTFFMGCIDLRSGELTYANAGHPEALLISAATDGNGKPNRRRLGSKGRPVGMPLGSKVTVERELLKPGDLLFVYSDGASEHLARQVDELEDIVAPLLAEPAKEIVREVESYLQDYFRSRGFKDDTTLLAIKVLPALVTEEARLTEGDSRTSPSS